MIIIKFIPFHFSYNKKFLYRCVNRDYAATNLPPCRTNQSEPLGSFV